MVESSVSASVIVYLLFGVLYQYLVYGDAPINQISTWIHVLFWFWIMMFHIFIYVIIVALVCVILAMTFGRELR